MDFLIIPEPCELKIISPSPVVTFSDASAVCFAQGFEKAFDELIRFFENTFELSPDGTGMGVVCFEKSDSIQSDEGYVIKTHFNTVTIFAKGAAGAFYGVQTLKQLLIQGNLSLPELEIHDSPRFEHRGLMLDSARYFFPPDDVKKILDTMALHKLNRFHWHLTDDQGFRIELYSALLLAQIGGFRAYTNFNRTPHGGFYSKKDIEEIIQYAAERFIKVIPEIDSPGHVLAAVSAYPKLSCCEKQLDVATHSGVKHDVLCVGKKSTFDFMFTVFDEVCSMFPDKIIHIGGDEVPTVRWKSCPDCQRLMKEKGFEDEDELRRYYLEKISEHLEKKGFDVIMWDDGLFESEKNKNTIRQYWETKPSKKDENAKKIISFSELFYLDLPHGKTSLKKCFDGQIEPDENTLGVEACLWTEYVPNIEKAGKMLIPRLAALSCIAWSKKRGLGFKEFKKNPLPYYQSVGTVGLSFTKPGKATPNKIAALCSVAAFEKRRLHWQGLKNIIDDKKTTRLLEAKAAKQKGETKND